MNEEKALIESIENNEWTSIKNKEKILNSLVEAANNTIKKDQRINIRITKKDLLQLKAKALQEGLPYQTLITSIIHKYVNG